MSEAPNTGGPDAAAAGTWLETTPLRQVRTALEQTLEDVSHGTGIDVGTLSRIERGGRTTPETAEKLVKHFGPSRIDEMRILYPHRYVQ